MKRLCLASLVVWLFGFMSGLAQQSAQAQSFNVQGYISSKSTGPAYVWVEKCSNDIDPPALYQYKSRGTSIDAHGLVQGDDCLGKNSFVGSGRTSDNSAAAWLYGCVYRAMVDGPPANGYMPTRFQIDTSQNSGDNHNPIPRFTIKSNGRVGIGTTNPGQWWNANHWEDLTNCPANLALHVVGTIITTQNTWSNSFVTISSRDYKLRTTPVPATGAFSLGKDLARGQRNGAWDLLDQLSVVDYEYKKTEQHWVMPDGRIAKSYDEATSTVTRVTKDGRVVTETLTPDQLGAKDFTAWLDEGSGEIHRGFIAEEVPDEFTTDHKSVLISDVTANNTAALKEAKRRILELEKTGGSFDTRLADLEKSRDALDEKTGQLTQQVQDLATGVIRVEDLQPGTENKGLVLKLTESVLRQIGVDPWVEISLADAIETVSETTPVASVKTVTKYRLNIALRQIEPYTVEESVTEQVPTGQTVERLKSGVRLDETTGKLYRWVGLSSADAAQKLAALHTKFGVPPSGGVSAIASHQTALRASVSHRAEETAENTPLFLSSSLCVLKPADAR
jgi:hypothetical protein